MSKKNMAAGDEVAEMMRDAIISGELKPRERLIETELSKRYGVSRTPIREAIHHLESAGLVKVEPYKGAIVADVDVDEIREVYEVRVYLESLATRLATPHMTPEILEQLEQLIRDMEESAAKGDATEFTKNNDIFHKTIYCHCGNRVMVGLIDDLLARSVVFRRAASRSRKNIENINRTHRDLLEAMKCADTNKAQQVAENHIRLFLTKGLTALDLE